MSEQKEDADLVAARQALSKLMELFDNVQILADRYDAETGTTFRVNVGAGNIYARRGHAAAWLMELDEEDRIDVLEDEGDE